MRFGEELVAERIPEWADKYLDYKTGKKLIKAVADAIARAEQGGLHVEPRPLERTSNVERSSHERLGTIESAPESPSSDRPLRSPRSLEAAEGVDPIAASPPLPPSRDDHIPRGDHVRFERSVSPPSRAGSGSGLKLDVAGLGVNRYSEAPRQQDPDLHRQATTAGMGRSGTAMGRSVTQRRRHGRAMNALLSSYPFSAVRTRFFEGDAMMEEPLNPTDPVEQEKNEFFKFMLTELQKIETFYASKEKDAEKRLGLLREQLYEMRSRRGDDEFRSDMAKKKKGSSSEKDSQGLFGRVKDSVFELKSLAPGKSSHKGTSPAVALATPILTALPATESQKRRDFVPKLVVDDEDVSYPEAKRKLKIALHEFYRTLNMINSYAALNRTAFQKLNKKYDKNARSSEKLEFVRHYVDKSAFVNSTAIEDHMRTVEDLFARYFEHGDNKTAMTKLRSRSVRDEFTGTFFSGLLVGFGFVFSVQGLISALRMRFDPDLDLSKHEVVGSHMQIYAGYFMILCMLWMFCLICKIWTQAKVNYQFIFEFDTRHSLDWRKLCHFPAVFTLLFGVIFWLNFSAQFGGDTMFLYYPVVLIGVTLLIVFLPLPVFHHKSRLWFAYSNYRLLMAPFYEVEFRDVFLGDIYTSLRYPFANTELFFCVYINGWNDTEQCGSSRSRLMAFLSTLPFIWRAIQCLRRYYDTRGFFPHMANCGKYLLAISSAATLSEFRIGPGEMTLSFFIGLTMFSTIYSTWWDIYMDFRLAQKKSPKLLRDILAFNREWVYYAVMVADVLLRMTWVFFIVFRQNAQHSSVASFVIALFEVFRRTLWVIFRVENEHCVNIANNKASRDIPLPYRIRTHEDH